MSIQSFTAGTGHSSWSLADAVTSIIEGLSVRLAARRCYRTVRDELLDYSPEQLAELGISDADIEFVAHAAAHR